MSKPAETSLVSFRSFVHYCRPRWKGIALTMTIIAVSNVLLAVVPTFIGKLVDALTTHHAAGTDQVWRYVIILIALSSLHDVCWRIGEFSYRRFVNPLSFTYETLLFRQVIAKPYEFFTDKFTGKISSYITTISKTFSDISYTLCVDINTQFIYLGTLILILLSVNWQSAAIFTAALVGMYVLGRVLIRYDMHYQRIATDATSTKDGYLIDAISNFAAVKAFHTEHKEYRFIAGEQARTLAAAQRSYLWAIAFWAGMSLFIRHLLWPAIILLNVHFVLAGVITVGQFATVMSCALLFSSNIWVTVWYVSQFGRQFARTDEAHEYLFGKEIVHETVSETSSAQTPFTHSFDIRNLSFSYPDKPETLVLHEVNLRIRQGEKVGIVGRSGSGKSTLTKLLLNYYQVEHGVFYFDEKPVSAETVAAQVAFVPQDTTLFHRSIADNIAYAAADNVAREDIKAAAQNAEAHEFIEKLSDGYDTLVGERGVKLSGGQRQRIAIARAILRDAPLLVLDEATSSLDSESEQHIQRALENLWQDKTVIAIAHRLSTLRKMDRIIVMDHGHIIEEGTHESLLKRAGTYAKLWTHQSGGFIDE